MPDRKQSGPGEPPARRRGISRRALGALGEQIAVEHLRRLDFVIVARNVRTRHGEIDLIAFDGARTLVFVEVKTRRATGQRRGLCPEEQPLAWLKVSQRARLRRLACAWLYENAHNRPRAHTIRFDAIGAIVDGHGHLLRLDHIEGAW
ncbi:MAG TPA: YraN family protein [Solirubrobacteraceae bacterium]|jgi:putative endonuclease|nr:YraN family protein [Solirubrobacteraceae bacterium]